MKPIQSYQNFCIIENSIENEILFSKTCKTIVNCCKTRSVENHMKTKTHIKYSEFVTNSEVITRQDFYRNLCDLFVSINISLKKLSNELTLECRFDSYNNLDRCFALTIKEHEFTWIHNKSNEWNDENSFFSLITTTAKWVTLCSNSA